MSEPLSPRQRLKLIRLVNALPGTEFDELLFALKPKNGVVPPSVSAQGNRAKALLEWVEGPTGCGLPPFLEVFDGIAPGKFKVVPAPAAPAAPKPLLAPPKAPAPILTVDLRGSVTLEMVYVPGGRFWMGSPESELQRSKDEGPQHRVTVPGFYMGKYPVTQRQWRAVSLLDDVEQPLAPDPSHFKGDALPVEQVSWYEAVEFCRRLSQDTRQTYRLPSEAEWEYACRAHTSSPFSFGGTLSTDQANYNGNHTYGSGKEGIFRGQTTPVGSFPANDFGLHDVHGNVFEWCQDSWHRNYEGAPEDGSAWTSSDERESRVLRGGSWDYEPRSCRSAYRNCLNPSNRDEAIGFRVVCCAP